MAQLLRHVVLISALALGFWPGVQAHMEMRSPYSFRSKFNPADTDPDYSNTSPLLQDGSNYPCKGYKDLPGSQTPVATYSPGQTYTLTLAGAAPHGGGSCQVSLSYDDGLTFRVIKSIIGGCPLKLDYDFTIPGYAPPSQSAILAWTWFNHIGNREMYMQCARVAITGQAVPRYRRAISKRQSSIDELPEAFKCNIGNGCTTLENHEIVFPNPGSIVETGANTAPNLPGPGYVINGAAPPSNTYTPPATTTVSTTASAPPSTTATTFSQTTPGQFYPTSVLTSTSSDLPSTTTTTMTTTTAATTFATFTTVTTTTIATSPAPPSATLIPGTCTPGTFACNSPSSWSQCVTTVSSTGGFTTTYIYMGNVAAGMQCVSGQIIRGDSSSACAPVGVLQCDGGWAFHTCVSGDKLDMGGVPAGMVCTNGQVMVAS